MSVNWLRGGGIHKNGFHRTYSPTNLLWSHTHTSMSPWTPQALTTPLPHANLTVWSPRFRRYRFSNSTLLNFTRSDIIVPHDINLGWRSPFQLRRDSSICRHSPLTYTFTEQVQILASQTFTKRAECATLSLSGVVVSPTEELVSNLRPGEILFLIPHILWKQ